MATPIDQPKQGQKPQQQGGTGAPAGQKQEMRKGTYPGEKAEVVEVLGRTGTRGEIHQVMARVLTGKDRGRVIRRNIKGKVGVGDMLVLLETEREAKQIRAK